MAYNLGKKRVILFIFLSIFFVSSLHGSPFLDPNASGRNTGMKLVGGRSGGGARHFRGRPRAIPLNGGGGAHKSHRSGAASQGSYSSLVLVLAAAAAAGAAIL